MPMDPEALVKYLQLLRAAKVEQFELDGVFKVSFFSEEIEGPAEMQPAVGFMADQNAYSLDEDDA